jgi:glucose-6-phosphate isomerase
VVVESLDAPGFADARSDAIPVILGADVSSTASASGFAAAIDGPLGAQMLTWEYAIVVAGRQIGINPFDQPDVESAKAAARGLLDAPARDDDSSAHATFGGITASGAASVIDDATSLTDVLARFLATAPESGYVAVQAYLDRLTDDAARLRAIIARKTGLQTTFGWGPRFLHSTGQYHKGGHPNGVFLQITGDASEAGERQGRHDEVAGPPSAAPSEQPDTATVDLAVPGRPYTLAVLQAAQAAGDAQVLRDHGRPVLTLHLADRAAGLDAIAAALQG